MKRNWIFAISLTTALCGCGTLDNMTASHKVYGGVRTDVKQAAQSTGDAFRAQNGREAGAALASSALCVLDAPLSAVGDTVTLPVTVRESTRK
jgi:uncharacterized protein YceK